jgi:hypothetical protein
LREADDVVVMRVVASALAALGRERKPVLEGSGAVGGRNDPAARLEQSGLIGRFSTIVWACGRQSKWIPNMSVAQPCGSPPSRTAAANVAAGRSPSSRLISTLA